MDYSSTFIYVFVGTTVEKCMCVHACGWGEGLCMCVHVGT